MSLLERSYQLLQKLKDDGYKPEPDLDLVQEVTGLIARIKADADAGIDTDTDTDDEGSPPSEGESLDLEDATMTDEGSEVLPTEGLSLNPEYDATTMNEGISSLGDKIAFTATDFSMNDTIDTTYSTTGLAPYLEQPGCFPTLSPMIDPNALSKDHYHAPHDTKPKEELPDICSDHDHGREGCFTSDTTVSTLENPETLGDAAQQGTVTSDMATVDRDVSGDMCDTMDVNGHFNVDSYTFPRKDSLIRTGFPTIDFGDPSLLLAELYPQDSLQAGDTAPSTGFTTDFSSTLLGSLVSGQQGTAESHGVSAANAGLASTDDTELFARLRQGIGCRSTAATAAETVMTLLQQRQQQSNWEPKQVSAFEKLWEGIKLERSQTSSEERSPLGPFAYRDGGVPVKVKHVAWLVGSDGKALAALSPNIALEKAWGELEAYEGLRAASKE